ncbi:TPM domain-containing protein [Candidatus Parcubacteria bacterium]|nr:TPM domain-containing protein [Candidatus Parcubacteria bacterium]
MKRVLFASILTPLALFAYVSPGSPRGYVNDFAGMLSSGTVSSLEQSLSRFENQSGAEIAIVTVPNLGGDTVENYAVKLFEEWNIGKSTEDNGLLLLISRDDRQIRIEVGYGLEPIVTDIESGRIIREIITPAFQNGNYDEGVTQAVARFESDIGDGTAPPEDNNSPEFGWAGGILYFIFFTLTVLGSILGRSKSWWAGGVIGAGLAVILGFFFSLKAAIFAGVFLIPIGLLFDFLVSRSYQKHKDGGPKPPWFFGGGGGGGHGGFGGFGGGSSGGGGASGRW